MIRTVAGRARSLARALRYLPQRLLHPLRRRATLRRIRSGPPPARVLFLCHGNICRSPYAAAIFRRGFPDDSVRVASAGFIRPGRPSPRHAREVARERGLELDGHRSRVMTADEIREADLVFVMDDDQRRRIRRRFGKEEVFLLGDLDPRPIDTRRILDPILQPRTVFETVYSRIDRCVQVLAEALPRA